MSEHNSLAGDWFGLLSDRNSSRLISSHLDSTRLESSVNVPVSLPVLICLGQQLLLLRLLRVDCLCLALQSLLIWNFWAECCMLQAACRISGIVNGARTMLKKRVLKKKRMYL